jgi:hypothetical protein
VGTTEEDVTIAGGQLRIRPNGQTTVSEGALLALPNNSGHFTRDRFTQVPEFGFEMSLPIGSHLVLSTGVTALYWGRTLRAGDQAESVVDIRQIPNFPGAATAGATAVTVSGASFHESPLWLVGLTLSAEINW